MGDGTPDTPSEPSGDARPIPAAPQEQPFLHRPIALVTLVGGVIGIVAAIVGIVVAISGAQRPAEGNQSQAAVEACMVEHGMESPREKKEGTTKGSFVFLECTWPAPPGAAPDGFAQISVRSDPGPGESEAEGLTVADRLRSTCRDVDLVYLFDSQGTFDQEAPILLSKGEIRRVEDGSIWSPGDEAEAAEFAPRRDESIVLANTRYKLDSARCHQPE